MAGFLRPESLDQFKQSNQEQIDQMVQNTGNSINSLIQGLNLEVENKIQELSDFVQEIGGIPVGTLISGLFTQPPLGYLICDGQEVLYNDYKNLGDHFFNTFGAINHFGGTEESFALPDLTGRYLRSASLEDIGTLEEDGLPNITGNYNVYWSTVNTIGGAFYGTAPTSNGGSSGGSNGNFFDTINFNASRSNPIYGEAEYIRPKNIGVLTCIKF